MKLPVLALFGYTVRLEARNWGTYAARVGLVGIVLFSLVSFQQQMRFGVGNGLHFFSATMFVNLVFISIFACSRFSTCITEEKEEQTLGLLRMTSLNGVSILLGKSTARLLGAVLLLLAQLPFTLLAVTLGGIATGQILAGYLTLAAYLALLSSVGLLASVVCGHSRRASALTLGFLLLLFLGPVLGEAFLDYLILKWSVPRYGALDGALRPALQAVGDAGPHTALMQVMTPGWAGSPLGFQVKTSLAATAIAFGLAWVWFTLRGHHDTETSAAPALSWWRRLLRPKGGRAWRLALVWKDFHHTAGGVSHLCIKFAALLALFGAMAYSILDNQWDTLERLGGLTAFLYGWLLVFELAYHASRTFAEEVREQTLSALLMLPISVRRIAYHKATGCLLASVPTASFFFLGVLLASDELIKFADQEPVVLGYLVCLAVCFIHLAAYLSLVLRRGALAAAMLALFAATFLYFTMVSMLLIGASGSESAWKFFLFVKAGILALTTVWLHAAIGRRLQSAAAAL